MFSVKYKYKLAKWLLLKSRYQLINTVIVQSDSNVMLYS